MEQFATSSTPANCRPSRSLAPTESGPKISEGLLKVAASFRRGGRGSPARSRPEAVHSNILTPSDCLLHGSSKVRLPTRQVNIRLSYPCRRMTHQLRQRLNIQAVEHRASGEAMPQPVKLHIVGN